MSAKPRARQVRGGGGHRRAAGGESGDYRWRRRAGRRVEISHGPAPRADVPRRAWWSLRPSGGGPPTARTGNAHGIAASTRSSSSATSATIRRCAPARRLGHHHGQRRHQRKLEGQADGEAGAHREAAPREVLRPAGGNRRRYLKKRRQVYIGGSLRTEKYRQERRRTLQHRHHRQRNADAGGSPGGEGGMGSGGGGGSQPWRRRWWRWPRRAVPRGPQSALARGGAPAPTPAPGDHLKRRRHRSSPSGPHGPLSGNNTARSERSQRWRDPPPDAGRQNSDITGTRQRQRQAKRACRATGCVRVSPHRRHQI